jgi:hypothetical protein
VGPEALNRDNCFTGRGAPHFGQWRAMSFADLARCSNWWPQRLHWYSNRGMVSQVLGSGSCHWVAWRCSRRRRRSREHLSHRACQPRRRPGAPGASASTAKRPPSTAPFRREESGRCSRGPGNVAATLQATRFKQRSRSGGPGRPVSFCLFPCLLSWIRRRAAPLAGRPPGFGTATAASSTNSSAYERAIHLARDHDFECTVF